MKYSSLILGFIFTLTINKIFAQFESEEKKFNNIKLDFQSRLNDKLYHLKKIQSEQFLSPLDVRAIMTLQNDTIEINNTIRAMDANLTKIYNSRKK